MSEDRASLFRTWSLLRNPKLWSGLGTVCGIVVTFLYRMTAAELEAMHERDDTAQASIAALQAEVSTLTKLRTEEHKTLRNDLIEAEARAVRVQAASAERDARKRAQTGADAEFYFREQVEKGTPIPLAARKALETKPPSR